MDVSSSLTLNTEWPPGRAAGVHWREERESGSRFGCRRAIEEREKDNAPFFTSGRRRDYCCSLPGSREEGRHQRTDDCCYSISGAEYSGTLEYWRKEFASSFAFLLPFFHLSHHDLRDFVYTSYTLYGRFRWNIWSFTKSTCNEIIMLPLKFLIFLFLGYIQNLGKIIFCLSRYERIWSDFLGTRFHEDIFKRLFSELLHSEVGTQKTGASK